MNTKPVPAIIMLSAGFVACIVNIVKGSELKVFIVSVLVVLFSFYILGLILKLILDKTLLKLSNPLSDIDDDENEVEEDLMDELLYYDEIDEDNTDE